VKKEPQEDGQERREPDREPGLWEQWKQTRELAAFWKGLTGYDGPGEAQLPTDRKMMEDFRQEVETALREALGERAGLLELLKEVHLQILESEGDQARAVGYTHGYGAAVLDLRVHHRQL